jgi:uncharacterized membrane protein
MCLLSLVRLSLSCCPCLCPHSSIISIHVSIHLSTRIHAYHSVNQVFVTNLSPFVVVTLMAILMQVSLVKKQTDLSANDVMDPST